MFRIIKHKSTKKDENSPLQKEKKSFLFINIRGEQIKDSGKSIIVSAIRRKAKSEYILPRTQKLNENEGKGIPEKKSENLRIFNQNKFFTILEKYRKRNEKSKKILSKNKEERVKLKKIEDQQREQLKICQIGLQKNGKQLQFRIMYKDYEKSKKKREQKKLILKNRSLKVLIIKQNKYACNKIRGDNLKHNLKVDVSKV